MSSKRSALFKLSQQAKRLIATSGKNANAIKKLWVEAEYSAQYQPRKSGPTSATGADNSGDALN